MTGILNNIGTSNKSYCHWQVMTSLETTHFKIWRYARQIFLQLNVRTGPIFSDIRDAMCPTSKALSKPLWDRTHWLVFELTMSFKMPLLIILIKIGNNIQRGLRSRTRQSYQKFHCSEVRTVHCSVIYVNRNYLNSFLYDPHLLETTTGSNWKLKFCNIDFRVTNC